MDVLDITTIEQKLKDLGINLPDSNPPAANYIPYTTVGNLVFIAGQTCKWHGELQYAGKVGEKYSLEEAQKAARLCGLNVLMQIKHACNGNLEKVKKCVRLGVFLNSTDNFSDQAKVANGVSDLMVEVFGENGRHVRTTTSSNSLPSQTTVEVEAVFEVE
ncbi:MAG: RidA family protein [Proteobacteria bacterium]|nr:RidA family protein [Pseudomonadota bacterium]